MPDLVDASVWLPLSVPDHVHHERALRYWHEEAASSVAFCRVTALALLRLLSNPRVLGRAALTGAAAWTALQRWLALPEIVLVEEPPGLDELLADWSGELPLRGGDWTDAYLAAFARAGNYRLVAFDGDFARYRGVTFLHLAAR
ncbi:MAG TPA: TA system VapC family ribonuclease toxin [Gemmatimonadaceae bacterium]